MSCKVIIYLRRDRGDIAKCCSSTSNLVHFRTDFGSSRNHTPCGCFNFMLFEFRTQVKTWAQQKEGLLLSSVALEGIQWIAPTNTLLKLGLLLACNSSSVPFLLELSSSLWKENLPCENEQFYDSTHVLCAESQHENQPVLDVPRGMFILSHGQPYWDIFWLLPHLCSLDPAPKTYMTYKPCASKMWSKSNESRLKQTFCVRLLNTNREGAQCVTIAYRTKETGTR